LIALNAASKQARIALGNYYVFIELTRKRPVVDAINNNSLAFGVRIVVGALIRDLIVNLASLFDHNTEATDLRRIINALLHPDNRDTFEKFHASFTVPYESEVGRERLRRYQRRLGKGELGESLQRIISLRTQVVAHLDQNPEYTSGRPLVRDIDHVLAAACIIIWNANVFAVGRWIDAAQTRGICRGHASTFAAALLRGIEKHDSAGPVLGMK
jgi:AbiU2